MKIKKNKQMFYYLAKEIMTCKSIHEFDIMRLAIKGCSHISMLDKCYLNSYLDERQENLIK